MDVHSKGRWTCSGTMAGCARACRHHQQRGQRGFQCAGCAWSRRLKAHAWGYRALHVWAHCQQEIHHGHAGACNKPISAKIWGSHHVPAPMHTNTDMGTDGSMRPPFSQQAHRRGPSAEAQVPTRIGGQQRQAKAFPPKSLQQLAGARV